MKKIHQKGVTHILIILAAATLLIVGVSAYLVFGRPSRKEARTTPEVIMSTIDTEPNGTADNAINAAENQLSAELNTDNDALDEEDNAAQIDESLINEIEATVNEENL